MASPFESSPSVHRLGGMVDALHSNPVSLLAGALLAAMAAFLCAWETGDGTYVVFAGSIVALALLRMGGRVLYLRSRRVRAAGRRQARERLRRLLVWKVVAIVEGSAAALLLGGMAAYAIVHAQGVFAPLATCCIAFANSIGVAGRSFGSPVLVRLQAAALYLPVSAAFAATGEPAFAVLAAFPALFILLVMDVSNGQRGVLEGALEGQARSETLARQLSIAMETTPNGVLMFDAGGILRLSNRQAADLLDLRAADHGTLDVAAAEARLRALLEPVGGTWPADGPLAERCELRLRTPAPGREHDAADGRLFEIHPRRNGAGELVARVDDVTEARLAERRITHLARFDGLTGLANRAWFFSRGEAMLPPPSPAADPARSPARGVMTPHAGGRSVCVATLDVDGLKAINDTRGHAVADAVLSALGERLSRVGGAERLCARLGSDEFAVLTVLEGPGAQDVALLREELEQVARFTFDAHGGPVAVQATLGLCIDAGAGLTLDELIERADFAQALAKADPQGVSSVFEPGMEASFDRAKRLREDIATAIRGGDIRTVYQPIWSVGANRPSSYEALARWTHATFGPVPPDEFVRLAEEIGLVSDLTRLQLDAATRFCAELPGGTGVSVNLSARDFDKPDLPGDIAGALRRSGLAPQRLIVEVTETSLLELGPATFATFEAIRAMGVRIALDDFGTGFSSLSYLQRLQLDIVKVDRAFLTSLHEGTRTASVLAAVHRLARGLDMAVVVEGVETPEQLDTLTGELGFDLLQGYLYGAPMPAGAARTLLERCLPPQRVQPEVQSDARPQARQRVQQQGPEVAAS